MKRFLINLDSSNDRLEKIAERLDELGISFERQPAINGRELSSEYIRSITYPYNHFASKVLYTRELTRGEVGCFLSHRECWKKLVESDSDWALIMEDDIRISQLAQPYLSSITWIPEGVKICQLSCLKRTLKGRILPEFIKVDSQIELVIPTYPSPLGTQCYLISKEVAEVALTQSLKLIAPVDDFLFSPWFDIANKYRIYRTSPTLVVEDENLISNIGNRNKTSVKKAPFYIRHGFTRFVKNWQIKRYQQSGENFTFLFKEH